MRLREQRRGQIAALPSALLNELGTDVQPPTFPSHPSSQLQFKAPRATATAAVQPPPVPSQPAPSQLVVGGGGRQFKAPRAATATR